MGRKTVSLDASACAKLKAAKRSGESFSDVIRRVLRDCEPSLLELKGGLDEEAADQLSAAISRMSGDDVESQGRRYAVRG